MYRVHCLSILLPPGLPSQIIDWTGLIMLIGLFLVRFHLNLLFDNVFVVNLADYLSVFDRTL